jgi:hypothetical protein
MLGNLSPAVGADGQVPFDLLGLVGPDSVKGVGAQQLLHGVVSV